MNHWRRFPFVRTAAAVLAAGSLLSCAGGAAVPGSPEPGGAQQPGTLAIPPLPLPRTLTPRPEPEAEPGLVLRLREAAVEAAPEPAAPVQPAVELLPAERADRLLARLPALPAPAAEAFRFPAASPPPPRTGRTLLATFPPPDTAAPAVPRPAAVIEPLRVVRIVPTGEAEPAPHLTITFSDAMVPLTTVAGTEAITVPVRLTPQPPGRWVWIDTRTLRFEPDGRLPMATVFTVEVPAGTRSAAGTPLEQPVRAEFATPAPRATGAFPALHPDAVDPRLGPRPALRPGMPDDHARSVPLEPVVLIAFDQAVDPAAVLRSMRLFADGRARPLRLATAAEVGADSVVSLLVDGLPAGRWVALRPVQPLPTAADVRVVVEPGAASAEGPRTTAQPQALRFRTYGPLRIASHGCGAEVCRPGMPWLIELTNPLDEAAWSPALVRVEPELKDMVVQVVHGGIRISGDARPNTRYRVTLSPAVRDRFGQTLEEPRAVTFDVAEPRPMVTLPGAPFVVLDPEGPPRLVVHSQGYRSLRVRVHRVTPDQWLAYGLAVESLRSQPGTFSPPGDVVTSTVVAVAGGGIDFAETLIDVGPALRDGLGHAIVVIEPEGSLPFGLDRLGARTLAYAWVQSTAIGLAAASDGADLVVWASSLRTGQPLAGADVRVLPSGRSTGTAADGTARLTLVSPGDALVTARVGTDVALLPSSEHATDRGRAWERRPQTGGLRWYMLTDRGLYRPGETVHFKGWLRQLPGRGAPPALAGHVRTIDFRMTGPRQEELAAGTLTPGVLGGFSTTIELPEAVNLGRAGIGLEAVGVDASEPGARASHSVQLQEFRRPEYEVSVDADPGPYIVGDVVDVVLHAAYYGGGGLGGTPVEWRVDAFTGSYTPPGWSRWRFGRAPRWGYGGPVGRSTHTLAGETDGAGAHRLLIDLLSVEPPFTTSVRAEAQVRDLTRQVGSAGVSLLVHPAAVNVGLRTARGWVNPGQPADVDVIVVDHDGRVVTGRTVDITLERIGAAGWLTAPAPTPAPARTVCRVESAAEPASCRVTADSAGTHRISADVRDDAGRVSRTELTLWVSGAPGAPDPRGEPGRFEVVADRDEYQPGDTARILVQPPFHPAEALLTVRGDGILAVEQLRIETPSHEVRLPIDATYIGGVNVRVELVDADDAVRFAFGEVRFAVPPHRRALDVRVLPRDSVALPGAETTIDVEVRDADGRPAAGAEVALWMVDEAVLALGNYSLRDPLNAFLPRPAFVQDRHSRRWVVHWPRSAGPGTLSGVVLGGAAGRALAGAIVRLDGTNIETRSAWDGSFTLRGVAPGEHVLEVTSTDGTSGRRTVTVTADGIHVGNLVLGEFGLIAGKDMARIGIAETLTVAGLAAAPPPPPAPTPGPLLMRAAAPFEQEVDVRTDFAPLAFFEPSLRTDADGRVQVSARLPQSLTRYRVMAVAVSGAERFGTGEAAVTARRELMVRIAAPRFLNYGDRFELPVLVQNTTSRTLHVDVAARAGGIDMAGRAGRRLALAPGARAELRFDAAALTTGTAHVQVIAAADDGPADAAAAVLPVYTPATLEAFATYGTIDTNAPVVLPLARPRDVVEGFGGLEVGITATALHALTDAVLYLQSYPFEGAEHIASRVLSVAALRDVLSAFGAEGMPDPDDMIAATQRDIGDLVARQNQDGGWAFWRAAATSHPFVSMHVAHALQRAREKDFDVPPAVFERAVNYLRGIERAVADWPLAARQSAAAYALYVRHRSGDPGVLPQARQLATAAPTRVGGELPIEAAGWLLHVLASDPAARAPADALRGTLMNRLVETAGTATFAERYDDGTHLLLHSRRRTDAVVLEALIAADGDADVVTKLAQSLLAHRTAGRWSGTQENAWVLLALDRYFRTYEATTPAFDARVWLGERFAGGRAFAGRTTDRQHISVPMPELLRADADELVIAREGAGRMYYRAALRYAPTDLSAPAADRGFTVSRVYEAVDDPDDVRRDDDGVWHVRAGARVRVRVTMVAPSVRYHAALVDPLPAGLEPLNPELHGTGFTDDPGPAVAPGRGAPPPPPRPGAPLPPPPGAWRRTWFEHQNLRDDRAEAFAALLPAGVYEYSYLARATTPGRFVVPPARAEMMYEPETFGRGAGDVVIVEESGGAR